MEENTSSIDLYEDKKNRDKEKKKKKKAELENKTADAILSNDLVPDDKWMDFDLFEISILNPDYSDLKNYNDRELTDEFSGIDVTLNKDKDYYWDQDFVKKKFNNNKEDFENNYNRILQKYNVLQSDEFAENSGSAEIKMNEKNSLTTSFAGKGSIQYGEQKSDAIDIQRATLMSYKDPDDGNYKTLTEEVRKKYGDRFYVNDGDYTIDPWERKATGITPYENGEELTNKSVIGKYDLDRSSFFNMAKEHEGSKWFATALPKSFNNTVLGVMGGLTDVVQSTLYKDPTSATYKRLEQLKNNLDYFKIGSTTEVRRDGPTGSLEALGSTVIDMVAQVGTAAAAGWLTNVLGGPAMSMLASQAIYTATVLDGTRAEALDAGLGHDAANLYTAASAIGFWNATKLSAYALEPSEIRVVNKAINKFIKKEAVDYAEAGAREGTKSLMQQGFKIGGKIGKVFEKVNKSYIGEGIIHEGLEEGHEEFYQEAARQLTNYYTSVTDEKYPTYDKNKGRFATFGDENYINGVLSNISTSAVLGGLGGGVIGSAKSIMNMKLRDVHEDVIDSYIDVVRQGKEKQFVSELNKKREKGLLGSETLSFTTNEDGDYTLAKNNDDSQAQFNYNLILNNLSTVKESLGPMAGLLNDDELDEKTVTLSQQSQDITKELIDDYKELQIGDRDIQQIESYQKELDAKEGSTKTGLEVYNSKNNKDITEEQYNKIQNIRTRLNDIKEGREHAHAYVRNQIKDDNIFGDKANRDDAYQETGEYFYEDALKALTKRRNDLQELTNIKLDKSKTNDAGIDKFIELHGNVMITDISAFTEGKDILLSKESIKKIKDHNLKIYKADISKYSSTYLATVDPGNPLLINSESFWTMNDLLVNLFNENYSNKDVIEEFSKNIIEVLKKKNAGILKEGSDNISTISGYIPYDGFGSYKIEEKLQELYEREYKNKEGEETSSKYYTLDAIRYLNNLEGDRKIKVFEELYDISKDDIFNSPEIVSDDRVLEKANPKLFEFNQKLDSLNNADDLTSIKLDDITYLEKILEPNPSIRYKEESFHSALKSLTDSFEEMKQGEVYMYKDIDEVNRLSNLITASNRFLQLSRNNLEFLGRLQRQIATNSGGGIVSYDNFSNGSELQLGVINNLITPALYDVEDIEYKRRLGIKDDALNNANAVDAELEYDELKISSIADIIDDNDSRKVYEWLMKESIASNTKVKQASDMINDGDSDIESISSKLDLNPNFKADAKIIKSINDLIFYNSELESINDEIFDIENDPLYTEDQKKILIYNASFLDMSKKIDIINKVASGEIADLTTSERQAMALSLLAVLKNYIENNKDAVSLVDFSKEIRNSILNKIKDIKTSLEFIGEKCKG